LPPALHMGQAEAEHVLAKGSVTYPRAQTPPKSSAKTGGTRSKGTPAHGARHKLLRVETLL